MAAGTMHGLPRLSFSAFNLPHYQDEEVKVKTEGLGVDFQFLETMGITLDEGRYFSKDFGSDKEDAAILNETAISSLGIDDPIGKEIGGKTIIGVVKDFNLRSIHSDIPPTMIFISSRYIQQIAVRHKTGTREAMLSMLKSEWERTAPDIPFRYLTVEDIYESQYSSEKDLGTIISIAALFTMLIAAFGLFGLTLFLAKSRTNEIGIKKVFGSSERSIIYSFLRSNILLVIISELLSIPVTLIIMTKWLNNFSYRTSIGWWVFLTALVIALVVVMLTVFIHSYRASRINPVDALRYE
jgi:putative ABC transport system permease protein